MNFQRSIITIAIIFLIFIIFGMWYIFHKGKTNTKYPPVVAKCPDYWELSKDYGEGNKEYRGSLNVTKSGLSCQRWDSNRPHSHTRKFKNYPNAGLEENYCRNPDNESNVWCYTKDSKKRWEECELSLKKNICVNIKKLGNGCKTFNPKDPKYYGAQGKIEKCKWAKNCGVVWDGITNVGLC